MSLKIDTGGVVSEEPGPQDGTDSNVSTPEVKVTSEEPLATPKGPLPTLLFARKHSMNVPRAIVKKAEEEESAAAALVTQVKKTGTSAAPSRPRVSSSGTSLC